MVGDKRLCEEKSQRRKMGESKGLDSHVKKSEFKLSVQMFSKMFKNDVCEQPLIIIFQVVFFLNVCQVLDFNYLLNAKKRSRQ